MCNNLYRRIKNNLNLSNNKGSRFIKSYSTCLKRSPEYSKGLTLVELMVVIAIFLIITTVAIFNYGNFNSTVSLQNLTDDIALSIRKAQSFAIGARDAGGSDFDKSYGIHFSIDEDPSGSLSGSNKSFLIFSLSIRDDTNTPIPDNKKKYTENSQNDSICGDVDNNNCVELFNILSVDKIDRIEAYNGAILISSNDSLDASIDIVFTRPDPKAFLCYRLNKNDDCKENVSSVNISISNGQEGPDKRTKIISIQNTGQISTTYEDK